MTKQNLVLNNTVGGELSPSMYARIDTPVYQKGLAICENFVSQPQGGAKFRNGSVFVKNTHANFKAVFIPFQFNDSQAYLLEFTNLFITFYRDGGVVLETASLKSISGATSANPGVFTTSSLHGYSTNQEVFLTGLTGGFSVLNGRFFYIASTPTTTTFTLKDVNGSVINTTGFAATSSGTTQRVYKIQSPFIESELEDVKYAQQADLMWLTHQNYYPVTLKRLADDNWVLDLTNQLNGAAPLNLCKNNDTQKLTLPRAVCFTADGRLSFGGTLSNPSTIWGSKQPDQSNGSPNYTNFGTSTVLVATDGYCYTMASNGGKADYIHWISTTTKFQIIGAASSVRRVYGAAEDSSASPLAINIKAVNTFGADSAMPAIAGSSFFYIERGSQRIRSIDYDYEIDAYDTTDMNLVAEHISYDMEQLTFQNATPDVLWGRRLDGKLTGMTYKSKENIAGWHRHKLGGSHLDTNGVTQPYGKVINTGVTSRSNKGERLWLVVERVINGTTQRTVEYIQDQPRYPIMADFYTGNKTSDVTKFTDANYEVAKDSLHLDCAGIYDGTITGVNLSLSASTGSSVTVTSDTAFFTLSMVNRQIWNKYNSTGSGSGRATITAFTSSTQVTVKITSNFDRTTLSSGKWMLTANTITALNHLEGQTVGVVADGAPIADQVVSNGAISLPNNQQASKVLVGLRYTGIIQTLNLDFGGQTGSSKNKRRQTYKAYIQVLNTIGVKIGTDIYNLQTPRFPNNQLDRGTPMYSGELEQILSDSWLGGTKQLSIVQDQPLPCHILGIDVYGDTMDE